MVSHCFDFDPYHFKDVRHFMELWRKMAKENGLKDIFFVAMCASTTTVKRNEDGTISRVMPNLESSADIYNSFLELGFDGINPMGKVEPR